MTARFSIFTFGVAALGSAGALLGVALLVALGGVIFGPGGGRSQFLASGDTVLSVTAGGGTAAVLTPADVDAMAREVKGIAALSRGVSGTALLASDSQAGQARVMGVDPAFLQVSGGAVAQGTFFTSLDAASADRVAVLGQALAKRLFPSGQTPLGATVHIRSVPFTVIGVLAPLATAVAESPDSAVLIPFPTAQVRLFGSAALDTVVFRVAVAQTDAVSQQVEQLLRSRHQVRAGQPDGFTLRSNANRPNAGLEGPALQDVGRVVGLAWQYGCSAKRLCSSAHS